VEGRAQPAKPPASATPQPQEPSITTLRKVFTKLGITSRTELARQLITQRKTD